MATSEERRPSDALGCRGVREASPGGLDKSWMVVNKGEDGELVDSQDGVDLDKLVAPESAARERHGAVDINEERTSAGIGTMQTYNCQHGDEEWEEVDPPNYEHQTSQQDFADAAAPVLESRVGGVVEVKKNGHDPLTPDMMSTEQASSISSEKAGPRPMPLFEVGSMVEVKGYGFGVVQWTGTLRGRESAGVELEEYRAGCGDGTPEGEVEKLFPCRPGHSVFSPVTDLVPDSRFMAVQTVNPLHHVPEERVAERTAVPKPDRYSRGRQWGIQGEHNSCYIDATLFGLFALSSEFDTLLLQQRGPRGEIDGSPRREIEGGPQGELAAEICQTLNSQIIYPLRKNGVLRFEPVQQLRHQLDRLGKMTGLTQEERDPEEFLNVLFKHVLSASPFISIHRPQGDEGEFFVQLFLEADPALQLPSIHQLLAKMFTEQDIKFSKVPQKLLVQVPRYGKQFKTFQRIVPDKCLHIKELCTREGLLSCSGEMTAHLQLLSVLCIETSHYVCFTRSEDKWIFMDSMADRVDDCYNIPSCVDCTEELEGWVYSEKHRKDLKKQPAKKLPEFVRRFTQDVYMCVYVEDSTYV